MSESVEFIHQEMKYKFNGERTWMILEMVLIRMPWCRV